MKTIPSLHDLTQRNVELIAKMEKAAQTQKNAGEACADAVAAWVGSWMFLITQTVIITVWMGVNVLAWWWQWDPYPFILLNLLLSFQAAYATPIILMSQNRQARINERRNHLDLQINLLSEQENTEQLRLLRLLCEKAGISLNGVAPQAYEEQTDPHEIVQQIRDQVESKCGKTGAA